MRAEYVPKLSHSLFIRSEQLMITDQSAAGAAENGGSIWMWFRNGENVWDI